MNTLSTSSRTLQLLTSFGFDTPPTDTAPYLPYDEYLSMGFQALTGGKFRNELSQRILKQPSKQALASTYGFYIMFIEYLMAELPKAESDELKNGAQYMARKAQEFATRIVLVMRAEASEEPIDTNGGRPAC